MEKVFILGGLRSHIGLKNGIFKNIRPEVLGAGVLRAVMDKYQLSNDEPEAILGGNAVGTGGNITRLMALTAGVCESVPAVTVDMQCASGLMSVDLAAAKIMSGQADLIIAGGFESSSMQPRRIYAAHDERYSPDGFMVAQFSPQENSPDAMLRGAERTAQLFDIKKSELDFWTLHSHFLAERAKQRNIFTDIIKPLFKSQCDEGIRAKMNQRLLDRVRPLFSDGIITAANACLINDGAAFVVLCSERYLLEHGITAQFEIVAAYSGGSDPLQSPLTVHKVVDGLLAKQGIRYEDVAAFEYNEAFGVIDVLFERAHENLLERYNIFGGALAYGHPYGASGSIILLHLMKAMQLNGGTYGVAAIAGAGGLGTAVLLKRAE